HAAPDAAAHAAENGKQERSGGYMKSNALKGRRFDSLDAQNAFLRQWNRTIARFRIHGTTRRQVWTHFVEGEQPALQPRPIHFRSSRAASERSIPMAMSKSAARSIRCRSSCSGRRSASVGTRISFVSSTATTRSSRFTSAWPTDCSRPRAGEAEASTRHQAYVDRLVGQCECVGPALKQWADAALAARGVRAIRLIQGVLSLTPKHSPAPVLP